MFSLKLDGGVLTVTYLSHSSIKYDNHRSAVYFVEDSYAYGPRSQFVFMGYEIMDIDSAVDLFIKRSFSNPRLAASKSKEVIPVHGKLKVVLFS